MNRREEYRALLQELEQTPPELNFTVARSKTRARRQRIRRRVGAPLSALSAVCAAFVLLVNVSAPFAMACASVPVLRELADAVCFSTSLSAAVDNDWVQTVGQTARDGDYTMTVEYVILDQKQLNIFYRLEGGADADPEDWYLVNADLLDTQGDDLPAVVIVNGSRLDGELRSVMVDITSEDTVPGQLRLECELVREWDESEHTSLHETAAHFAFDLSFDPDFTAQATALELNRPLELDGQRLLLKRVEIYPTHMRIILEDDPDNTAWLRGLDFYVEDENGNRFDAGSGNLTSTGSPDTPFTDSYRVESAFFTGGEHLTLHITGAKWLEKDRQWTWLDLSDGTIGYLPDEITLLEHSRKGSNVELVFRVRAEGAYFNPFSGWRGGDGAEHTFGSFGVSGARAENADAPDTPLEGYCDVRLTLEKPVGERVELEFSANRWTRYETPLELALFS